MNNDEMKPVGETVTMTTSDRYHDFLARVFELTSQLFYLLDAADSLADDVTRGTRPWPSQSGAAPRGLSVAIASSVANRTVTPADEFGHSGRLTQLAYVGWVTSIAAEWERYRTNDPHYKRSADLRHGMEADLFGDFQRIRNDLLKNRAKATKRSSDDCKILRWFQPGERMVFTPCHVLDYLHHVGCHLRMFYRPETETMVGWLMSTSAPIGTPKVISNRPYIARPPGTDRYGVGISMVFEDGIMGTVGVAEADRQEDLQDKLAAIESAPLDEYGAIVIPDFGRQDVPRTHRNFHQLLLQGKDPADPGSPPIRFGA